MLREAKCVEIVSNLYVNQKDVEYLILYLGHGYFYIAIDPQVSAWV